MYGQVQLSQCLVLAEDSCWMRSRRLTLSKLNISHDPSFAHHIAQPFVAAQASQQPSPKAETFAVPILSPLNCRELVWRAAQSACRIRALALLLQTAAVARSRKKRACHCMQLN